MHNAPIRTGNVDLVAAPFALVRKTFMQILMKWKKNIISEAKEIVETCFVFCALNILWRMGGLHAIATLSRQLHIDAIICWLTRRTLRGRLDNCCFQLMKQNYSIVNTPTNRCVVIRNRRTSWILLKPRFDFPFQSCRTAPQGFRAQLGLRSRRKLEQVLL